MVETDVSVIVVHYFTESCLFSCLKSVFEWSSGVRFEVILVDNGSTDGAWKNLKKRYPQVRLIKNEENIGFGAANNIGARHAKGRYLFFLNPDTLLTDNCLATFRDFLDAEPDQTASVGGQLITEEGQPTHSWGNLPSFRQQLADLGFRQLFGKIYLRNLSLACPGNFEDKQEVPYIIGADIFIRRSVFEKIGGFDERFFLYYEDTDLYMRLQQEGYHSFILPGAKIVHLGSVSTGDTNGFNYTKYAWLEKSKYLYFRKYRGNLISFCIKLIQMISIVLHKSRTNPGYRKGRLLAITLKS